MVAAGSLHAPHLLDVEFLHALRGLVRGGKLSLDRAQDARTDFADLTITRYPVAGMGNRTWQLRDNLTAYDACFVALAEALQCPVVTCDERLSRAAGHSAVVEVYPLLDQQGGAGDAPSRR
jgi:predicted nucleic acid-binding protein